MAAIPAYGSEGGFLAYGPRTNSSLQVPAGVAAGDVILAWIYADDGNPTITPPTGFTEVVFSPVPQTSSPAMIVHTYWKRATGHDTGYYTFTHANGNTQGIAARYTGCAPTGTPLEVLGSAVSSTPVSVTPAITGTTSADNELLIFTAVNYSSASWTVPAGFTGSHFASGELHAYKLQATAGSTGSITAKAGTSTATVAALLALLPDTSGGAPPVVQPIPAPSTTPAAWPPDPYRAAMRSGGYNVTFTVDASLGRSTVDGATGLAPTGGSITDTTKPGVRRTLNLELAPEPGLFDLLKPVGTTLTVTAHVEYLNKQVQDIPMGVFDVDSQSLVEGGGKLTLTAPDKWVRIQRARFLGPAASTKGMLVVDQITALIQGALGASEPVNVTATSTAKVGVLTWDHDRAQAIIDLATTIGAWVYFDRDGVATIADVPTIGAAADWLVDASPSGVLIDLSRQRDRTSTYNVVVVAYSGATTPAPFTSPQYVWDADPNSPTFFGTGLGYGSTPPTPTGNFGPAPYFYDTPILTTVAAARAAGMTILARTTGLASQISASQAPNPAVDAFDTIDVLPPKERYDIARVLERHVVDTVTHPLDVTTPQHIDGRSTRSDAYVGS